MGRQKRDYPLKDFYGQIHGNYDRVNRIFTFGQDVAWRKKAARECLRERPGRVLDLCTGTGDFILELARQADEPVELTGYDFSPSMLRRAREKSGGITGQSVRSLAFVEGDAARMPFKDAYFDAIGITFGIRNLLYENTRAQLHLAEIHRVLKPGGRLVVLESSRPGNIVWRGFHNLYLRLILPCLGGIISGNLPAYRYLSQSSRNYYSMEQMGEILEQAGFVILGKTSLFLGSVMLFTVRKSALPDNHL